MSEERQKRQCERTAVKPESEQKPVFSLVNNQDEIDAFSANKNYAVIREAPNIFSNEAPNMTSTIN